MKQILRSLLTFFLLSIPTYALFIGIECNYNFTEWSLFGRYAFAIFVLGFIGMQIKRK